MKRCPECGRDYNDDSLSYCLDDGSELLFGPASGGPKSEPRAVATGIPDEPATAILSKPPVVAGGHFDSEASTRAQIHTTGPEPQDHSGDNSERQSSYAHQTKQPKRSDRRLLLAALAFVVIVLGGFFAYRYFSSSSAQISSIAILPFQNIGGNPDAEYLSDGLAESLIYRLSQLPDLKVSPASSVMRYKGKEFDPGKIAGELGVQTVMAGRMTQRGDSLSISVELIDAANNKTLWGEQYERKMSDLLSTQREIAATIAEKLQLKFSGEETKGITKKYTESNEAYQLYLKGRHQWNKRTSESLKQAVEFYNLAVEKDPSFALAYSGIAESYVLFSNYDVALPKDSMPQAKSAALRALELDDSLAEAYTALGWYRLSYEYDWIGGERDLRQAIELNPRYATAHQWLGQLLMQAKRFDEGQAQTKLALEADPLSPIVRFNLGYNLYLARQYDEALKEFQNTINLYPNFPLMPSGLCWAAYAKGALEQAIPACRKALELVPDAYNTGYLALVLGRAGQADEARKLFEKLKAESSRRELPSMAFALAHMGLNQKEEALAMFEKEVDERGYWATSLAVLPELDEFQSDPRFKALLKRMNMAQ